MEDDNYADQLIDIQDSDGDFDSVKDCNKCKDGNEESDRIESSTSPLPAKNVPVESEMPSLGKDSCSPSSWKERGFSSGVTQDSLQCSSKRYGESQQSNDEEDLSNATDNQEIQDGQSGPILDTSIDEREDTEPYYGSPSKVKSVIKLSPSMHSEMQESLAVEKSLLNKDSTENLPVPEEHVLPDSKGFFTFPEDKNNLESNNRRFNFGSKRTNNLTKTQFLKRIKHDKVLVVSVFGRSAKIDSTGDKAFIFDQLMQKDVFRFRLLENETESDTSYDSSDDEGITISENSFRGSDKVEPYIEGYHDKVNGRIYLHLKGNFDSKIFAKRCAEEDMEEKDLHSFFSENKFAEAKLLLFLFHVSHLLVCYHETPYFDYTYVNLFQMLDSVRAKLHSSLGNEISKNFRKFGLPKDVINHGRFCIPKLVFYFATAPMGLRGSKGTAELIKRDGKVSKNPPIRKLEFSIEDQIYRIFRRVKLISTSSATSCLFSIPSRDGYVYVDNRENIGSKKHMSQNRDEMLGQLNQLFHETLNPRSKGMLGGETSSDASDSENSLDAKCNGLTLGMPYNYKYIVSNEYGKSTNPLSKINFSKRSFSKFLLTHIDFLTKRAEKGLTDGEERRSIYELPTSLQWYYGASCIFRLLGPPTEKIGFGDDSVLSTTGFVRANSILDSKTSIENRFSESRCAKALPNAITNYKEGLQSHYLYDYHQAKLLQAVTLFSHQSRGPSSKKYAELLVEECTAYWQAGRQMCEELSLTGHHCTNRKHLTHTSSETVDDNNVSNVGPTSKNSPQPIPASNMTAENDKNSNEYNTQDNESTGLQKELTDMLMEMSSDNFDRILQSFDKLEISNEEELNMCMKLLFQSAITRDETLTNFHAQLCEALKNRDFQSLNLGRLHVKKILVTKCQKEFEKSLKQLEELSTKDNGDSKNQRSYKKNLLGVMIFCGELYKLNILTRNIMHDCVRQLIQTIEASNGNGKVTDEVGIECLCKLLSSIGKELEVDVIPKTKVLTMDRYFDEIMNILDSKSFTSRSQDMIQELISLRQNNWIPSHESEAKKITGKLIDHGNNKSSEASTSSAKKNLPTLICRSSMTYISACNCGRRQVNRDDPFTLVQANFMFYAELEDECCGDLEHIQVYNIMNANHFSYSFMYIVRWDFTTYCFPNSFRYPISENNTHQQQL